MEQQRERPGMTSEELREMESPQRGEVSAVALGTTSGQADETGSSGPSPNPWEELRVHAMHHLDVLELAAIALIEGSPPPERLKSGFLGARSLEQLLTSRGLFEGARMARAVGQALDGENVLFPPQILQVCELVVALDNAIDQLAKPTAVPTADAAGGPVVMVVSRDRGLAVRLKGTEGAEEFQALAVDFPGTAGDLLAGGTPTAAVLDLHAGGGIERGLLLLDELTNHMPPIPVLVLLHQDAMAQRLEVARRGARAILDVASSAQAIADAVRDVLHVVRASAPKVLAVDGDPQMMGLVGSLLDSRGLDVTTLGDSSRFWDLFNQGAPDLVLLGAEVTPVSGLELCREIREDPFWRLIPVVMLTADNSAPAIERVFAAGADDFVAKPVVGPELLTRVSNRLERVYLQRQQAGTDGLTGVTTRQSADGHVRRLLRMSSRSQLPLSLAVLDVDGLRHINQHHGVQAGDAVLRRLGQVLTKTLRAEDLVARLGGDEFLVALYNCRRVDAVARLQTVLDSFRQESFAEAHDGGLVPSFSATVVQYLFDGTDLQWLYNAAGEFLAQAKQRGGGQLVYTAEALPVATDEPGYDVVIVEEDQSVASLLHRTLMNQGLKPLWIRDGQTAIDKLAGRTPLLKAKVVVLEVDLPGLDGMAVLRHLADDQVLAGTRVLMLTNRANEEEIVSAFEIGAFDHVTKPFSVRVLTQRIKRALQG